MKGKLHQGPRSRENMAATNDKACGSGAIARGSRKLSARYPAKNRNKGNK